MRAVVPRPSSTFASAPRNWSKSIARYSPNARGDSTVGITLPLAFARVFCPLFLGSLFLIQLAGSSAAAHLVRAIESPLRADEFLGRWFAGCRMRVGAMAAGEDILALHPPIESVIDL